MTSLFLAAAPRCLTGAWAEGRHPKGGLAGEHDAGPSIFCLRRGFLLRSSSRRLPCADGQYSLSLMGAKLAWMPAERPPGHSGTTPAAAHRRRRPTCCPQAGPGFRVFT